VAGSERSQSNCAGVNAAAAWRSLADMRCALSVSSWRSWLPASVGQSRAISQAAVSRGHNGPETMSPRFRKASASRASATTASSAGRLP
jgi:hypothetical protein